jgi:hypothetical protein
LLFLHSEEEINEGKRVQWKVIFLPEGWNFSKVEATRYTHQSTSPSLWCALCWILFFLLVPMTNIK